MAKVIDRDQGFRKMTVDVKALSGRSVKIGFWGDDIAEIAIYNEFGTNRGIPSRPFMQTTFDNNSDYMTKLVENLAGKIVDGKDNSDHVLRVLGEVYQSKIQMTIRQAKDWAVPNAPITIERKGSSSPLIDTGRMVGSVRYEIK